MKITKYIINLVLFLSILIAFSRCDNYNEDSIEKSNTDTNLLTHKDSTQLDIIDTSEITYNATIKTSLGKIDIVLFGNEAPKTVENFVGLAKSGYYNGVLIHRVAKNFLIQTGDGNTKYKSKQSEWGFGGKSIYDKEFEDEINPKSPCYKIGYAYGVIAMANKGPNTNTSQFFICLDEARQLEMKWTIFGKVVNGLDIIQKIANVEIIPSEHDKKDGRPLKPIKILSISVHKVK